MNSENETSLLLPGWLGGCPKCWINFVNYNNPDGTVESEQTVVDIINEQYNAEYIKKIWSRNTLITAEVKFASKDDLIYFKLKWG
jgi:hypothetical protein